MNVLATKPNPKNDKQAFVRLRDGELVIEAWSPELALVEPLVGKDLPSDWTLKDGPHGKQLLPPRKGGGGGAPAWKNTKEGFEAEQAMWARKQAVEEERRDRRTALMQATSLAQFFEVRKGDELAIAVGALGDVFYEWLRETSGSPSVGTSTPDDGNRGEGPTDGVAESGGGAEANGLDDALPSDAIKEPHDHVRGRQLASGKYLCAFELPDGSVCGEKME